MDPVVVGIIGLVVLLIALFMGLPVAYSMLIVGFVGLFFLRSFTAAFQFVGSDLFINFTSYTLSVAPMFALMGLLANHSGLGSNLFAFANKVVGRWRGGLAHATIGACAVFGAICGSMPATLVTFGSIAYPEMKTYGYDPKLSTGCIAAGAGLAILIPPSMMLIIYGIATEQSIGKLFMGGIFTGILLMVLYMITIAIILKRTPALAPDGVKYSIKECLRALRHGGIIEVIIVFIISLGGMFMGWFTPTESGAIGSFCMLVVTIIERKLKWENLKAALRETSKLAAMVFLMIAAASVYGRFFALTNIPVKLGTMVASLDVPAWCVMLVVLFIYLIMGCFIDSLAMILITVPIFYPIVVTTLEYDPIWFGVIIVLVVALGSLTPPVGVNVYILKGILKEVPMSVMFKGIIPFVFSIGVCMILLVAFPIIVTFLPNLMY
ncbi:MAG: TRAP transporter large permease [Clostridiales Family XIII bacterium]|jgi:tripartite ATP-independent transporter DctM subunit|nr:TRAP transporter large permease [Clostridiales Family XIII bacterium]